MKKAPVIILLACISVWLCSCNKFTVGEIIEETRHLDESFQVIEIRDDIDVSLRHCTADNAAGTIHIKTGENLIDELNTTTVPHTEINDGDTLSFTKLVITNDNVYNNLRPHNHAPQMTVYYDTLLKIILYSNAQNVSTDTLRGYNFSTHFISQDTIEWDSLAPNLLLEVEGGSGNFNALANCYKLTAKCIHGTSNLTIKGKATLASTYADYDCHGVIDCKELDTHIHYITTYGTNIIKARAYHLLDVKNSNIGSVQYTKYRTTREVYQWNDSLHQVDTIIQRILCPEVIYYNGEYIDIWTYNNDENSVPGLVVEP